MAISKFNYNSFNVTPVAGAALAFDADADGFSTATSTSMILIKTLTASSSANLSFVNGSSDVVLDDTYPVYKFVCINCHPSQQGGDGDEFTVGFRDGSTAYDATKTSTFFSAVHGEDGSGGAVAYRDSHDQAQATGFQTLTVDNDADNDVSISGELMLFNPSSTTFVKHFIWRGNSVHSSAAAHSNFCAGYCNVTAAIDAVQFKMSAGNIDSGTIKLYGIADS